jgi:hypothetical protein
MTFLKGGSFKDLNAERTTKENWLRNEKARFAAFPQSSFHQGLHERFLIPLDLLIPVRRSDISCHDPKQRFSYRGLSFLQWRMGTIFLRDVQNSDETRDL